MCYSPAELKYVDRITQTYSYSITCPHDELALSSPNMDLFVLINIVLLIYKRCNKLFKSGNLFVLKFSAWA